MAKGGYDFYLDKCLLPVPPQKLQMKIKNSNKTVTLIDDGQINILKSAGLTDIEFECEIPQIKYPFAVYKSSFLSATYFLKYFERLKTQKKPFQFIISRVMPSGRVLFSTNIKVSMEDYKITEQSSNNFDLTVKISLKQYREYGTKTVKIKTSSPKATVQKKRASDKKTDSTQSYIVVSGDCLWNIAKKFYGDGSKYTVIYNANKDVVGSNPNMIYPGQILTIPAI